MGIDRDLKFGKLLSVVSNLGRMVYDNNKPPVNEDLWEQYQRKPKSTFVILHNNIIEHAPKFTNDEIALLDLLGEIINDIEQEEFTDAPLGNKYLLGYYRQNHELNGLAGVKETSEIIGLPAETIVGYCEKGIIKAKKVGSSWFSFKSELANFRGV